MKKIAVIGAGITGVTTAYKLVERGYNVTVFDRQLYAGMETSFTNGGQLSASNAEVWTHPSTLLKGIKWLFKKDAPLSMGLWPSWHKLSWMAEFLSNIPNYEKNTTKTAAMAVAAREHLLGMADRAGVDFDHSACGILHFYSSQKDFDHARYVNGLLAKGGLVRDELAPSQLRDYEPSLAGEFVGGFWTPSDSTGDIHKFTNGLAEALKARGCRFALGRSVDELTPHEHGVRVKTAEVDEDFASIVICAGVGSKALARRLGDRVNIYPVKGYSITVHLNDELSQASAPKTSLLDDKAKIVTSRLGVDRFRIAGTAEFSGENRDIRNDRIKPLLEWCNTYFPEVSTRQFTSWAGLRPMMPNMMPRVAQGRHARVFYNTGHGHLGWTLSGITAEMVADLVVEARPTIKALGAVAPATLQAQA